MMDSDENGLFSNEELETLMGIFLDQATSILVSANQNLLRLEADARDAEALNQLQRALHTLKGDANSVGFGEIGTITHRLEDLLALWQTTENELAAEIIDLLLVGIDSLSDMLQRKRQWVHAPLDIESIQQRIDNFINQHRQTTGIGSPDAPTSLKLNEYQLLKIQNALESGLSEALRLEIEFDAECSMHSAGMLLLARQLQQVADIITTHPDIDDDNALEQAERVLIVLLTEHPEEVRRASQVAGVTAQISIAQLVIDADQRISTLNEPPAVVRVTPGQSTTPDAGENADQSKSAATETTEAGKTDGKESEAKPAAKREPARASRDAGSETLRVAAGKVDTLMDLVGELVISRSMLTQICSQLKLEFPKHAQIARLLDTNSYMGRVLGELQKGVMQVRMVSLDQTFTRFFRVVRDLARESGKQIELEISGEETELDKRVVDIIYEPLLHLVRNALDHGIEASEVRLQKQKPAHGRVSLRAYHQGDQVIIEVEDDGRGIDLEKLKDRAREKHLRNDAELQSINGTEALELIFLSGLSTAERVTEISGRGIGMDVVKSVMEGLKGSIEIWSEVDRGTRFTLRLPLTLAIIRAMLFAIEDRVFAIPLSSVIEITRAHDHEIKMIGRHKVYNLRETLYSLVELDRLLLRSPREDRFEDPFILIVGLGERRAGLMVDKVVGEREVVVKAVDKEWLSSELVTGASILGDGRVVLILDVAALLRRASSSVTGKMAIINR